MSRWGDRVSRTPDHPSGLYVNERIDPGWVMRLHPGEPSVRGRGKDKVPGETMSMAARVSSKRPEGVLDAKGGAYSRDLSVYVT
ncbi:hypothetical protein SAV31267_068240 [Streptomyces avermitilis]|uniref:Uncharacterized protein n=1 Tax=Streptomyces avermitilis TaxID=33903 RepID=A0A4D4N1F0_STRAX|nr:hypothetical protein SAV31267_068240 [Streptomyces avermitilis]